VKESKGGEGVESKLLEKVNTVHAAQVSRSHGTCEATRTVVHDNIAAELKESVLLSWTFEVT
jgi:hypothetical protein